MKISKTMMQASKARGTIPKKPKVTTKPAMILSMIWPTVILATKRTVKLKGFDKKEIISIGTISGANAKGMPLGRNVRSQPSFFFFMPMPMLNSKAMTDKPPTAAKCDVKVKA